MRLPLDHHLDYSKTTITLSLFDSIDVRRKVILYFETQYEGAKFKRLSKEISKFYDTNLSMYSFYKNLFTDFYVKVL
jgi:hypothetical protein